MIMMKCLRCGDECEFDGDIQNMPEKDSIHHVTVSKCSECYDEIKDGDEIIQTEYLDKNDKMLVIEFDVRLDSTIDMEEDE